MRGVLLSKKEALVLYALLDLHDAYDPHTLAKKICTKYTEYYSLCYDGVKPDEERLYWYIVVKIKKRLKSLFLIQEEKKNNKYVYLKIDLKNIKKYYGLNAEQLRGELETTIQYGGTFVKPLQGEIRTKEAKAKNIFDKHLEILNIKPDGNARHQLKRMILELNKKNLLHYIVNRKEWHKFWYDNK